MTHQSISFSAGYKIGQVVRPLLNSFRAAMISSTQHSTESDFPDYELLSATPAMVRSGVDLAQWQADNVKESSEIIPADWDRELIPANWDSYEEPSDPGRAFTVRHLKRSDLNDLI